MLELRKFSFGYTNALVFDNTDFKTDVGQLTVIKGESGIGKTTLLDIIALRHGNVFDIYYNSLRIAENEYLSHLYYMEQEPLFCDNLRIREQWKILSELYGSCSKLDEYVSILGLENVKNLYPSQLSGGEKLRVALINIFIIQPEIVLMDEPTASLDDEYKSKFVDCLNVLKQNCHLIVSTHDSHIFDTADVLYEIDHKKLCLIKSKKTINDSHVLNKLISKKSSWILEFLKMKKHHIIKEIITLLLISIPIALLAFSISMNINFVSLFQDGLSSLEDTHIIVYKPLDKRYKSYIYYCDVDKSTSFPISDDEYNMIEEIDGINEIFSKIILPLYCDHDDSNAIPQFKIYNNDKEIFNYQELADELISLNNYSNQTLYVEGVEDYEIEKNVSQTFNDEEDGIFLNEALLERCHLTEEDIKGGSIKVTIGIPVYDYSGDCYFIADSADGSTYYADDEMAANGIYYVSKEITLPIRGIIKENTNLYASNENAFYMSREKLEAIANSYNVSKGKTTYFKDSETGYVETNNKDEADLTLIYTPWKPNAYNIEVDSVDDVSKVVDELENLGYAVDWKYNDYKSYGESIQSTQEMIHIISIVSIMFITLIFVALHFIKGQEENKINLWLESIGYHSRRTLLAIKSQKYLLNTVMIVILSILIFWIINFAYLYMFSQYYAMNIKVILAIILVVLLTQYCIPMLWEVFQNVETRKFNN